jgi:cytosine/adenosine deaminase-related metal-dependent hydrolase
MVMRRTCGSLIFFVMAVAVAPCSLAQSATAPEQTGPYGLLEIQGATLIDGSGGPAFGPVNIYIRGNRIERVATVDPISSKERADDKADAKATKAPDRVIDGKGMYVMPGLIDVHTHINVSKDVPAEYIYKLFLGHGVTTIRTFNVGHEDPKGMVAEKKKIAANQIIAPRMYVYPFWARDDDPRNSNPEGARQIVDEWHALGVDGIKVLGKPGEWPDVFHAIADEARKNGMGVAVHIAQDGVYPMNAVRIAEEGASTIEHHYGYPESSFTTQNIQDLAPTYNYSNEADRFLETGRAWLQADLNKLHGEVIQSLLDSARSGFIMVPTFSIYEANRDVTRAANLPWHATYTLPVVMDSFLPNPAHHASYFYEWTSNKEADWGKAYRRWMEFVNDYKNQGGVVAVGSDSGFLFSLWGFGTIRELEMLEEAGFSPLETLHAATENGAKVVKNPELGLVRPGYLADLVVLSENPLADVKIFYGNGVTRVGQDRKEVHEQCVKYTIRDGVVFDSQALLRDVREMVSKARAAGGSKN